jgi:hypothetical protein
VDIIAGVLLDLESLLIAKYMVFPWRGVLNNCQYRRLYVATVHFAFQIQEKQPFISTFLKKTLVEIGETSNTSRKDIQFTYNFGWKNVEESVRMLFVSKKTILICMVTEQGEMSWTDLHQDKIP